MESEYFFNVVRAQLTTTATKPCTFFGTDAEGRRVFGKGPFPSKEAAEIAKKVSDTKTLLMPGITNPQIELVELVPDGMTDCQYGYRMTCDTDKPHWFQVVRDVMTAEKEWPPASKNRSSPKAWPEPVKVVDWSLVENYGHVEYNRTASKSIYKKTPETAFQFAANILMSWVLGAGADLALSNFLVDKTTGNVMQVDNDVWFNNDWWVSDTRACSTRSKAYDQFKKFVNAHMSANFFEQLATAFNTNKKAIGDIVGHDNLVVMEQKIVALGGKDCSDPGSWESAHKRWTDIEVCLPKQPESTRADTPVTTPKASEPVEAVSAKRKARDPPPAPVKKARSIAKSETQSEPVDAVRDDEPTMPEPIPLVRQQAIPPVVERGYEAFTPDTDIYIGASKSVYQHSTDAWGFSVSVRKSDMQKAIRRGDFRQAMVAFFACYNLSRIFGPGDANAKLIRTNIMNRLVICAVEDIGVANVMLVNLVAHTVDNLLTAFKSGDTDPNRYIKDFAERALANIIYQMCISKKTRIQSHLAHAYHEKNAHLSVNQFGLDWNYNPKSASDPNFIRVVQQDQAYAWRLYRTNVHGAIYKAWKRMSGNNRIQIIRYVFTALYYSNVGTIPVDHLTSINYSNVRVPEKYKLELYFQNKIKEDPKPYAYDMHVTGERTPEEKAKFRREGCYITNEDVRFNNRQYKKIYEISNV